LAHCPASGVYVYVPLAVLSTVDGDHVPLMPFGEVLDNVGDAEPAQTGANAAKSGVCTAFTVTVSTCPVAHCPASGVNVYVPLAVLSTVDGDHVPLMPFGEVLDNVGAAEPAQNGATAAKSGVCTAFTVTVSTCADAHCPASGVNVYVPLAVLSTVDGDHVPLIPFGEVVCRTGAIAPEQIGAIAAKSGVWTAFTVTASTCPLAHWPASGVNVYVPPAVLSTVDGDHVPLIPLGEVFCKTGAAEPAQNGETGAKSGVCTAFTVTASTCDDAHCPASGVNVYVPLAVLSTVDGDHVPLMPFGEVVCKTGAAEPAQTGETGAKSGVCTAFTVTASTCPVAH
jgi:formylmethanofuran dehydrogenase subunit D